MVIYGYTQNKAGIPRIEIPVRLKDLNEELLAYYLPQCVAQLKANAVKIHALKEFVDGTHQDIDDKQYLQQSSGHADNRIKENHAYEIVQFKEGFLLGDKKQFANKENVHNDDMTYLDKFLCDVDYYTKDLDLRHNIYATGIGTSFIMPRADIFFDNGEQGEKRRVTYLTTNDGYNVKVNAPFIYETVNSEENAVVYSSCIGESGLKDLFCFNIATVLDIKTKSTEEVVTVYTRQAIYEWAKGTLTKIGDNSIYGKLPMTEHSLNNTRISPIEVVSDLLNAINLLLSLETNSVEDKVNQLLIFLGCNMEQEDIDVLYEKGVICLPGDGASTPDVKTISNDLKYTETNVLIERVLTRCFDIVGVPLASAAVSSGNNEAAYLGGGWTNASTIINRDILHFEKSDREELRKMIAVCKLNPENPVNEISANEVDIKYNVNQSNNLLVKTQALQNLRDVKFPILPSLKVTHLVSDIETVGAAWAKELEKAKQEEQAQNSALTGDNLTGVQKEQQAQQTQAEQAKSVK